MSLEGVLNMKEKTKIKFRNTLSRKIETFAPIDGSEVKMYTCGPTVYGRAHIGNMRAYIFADVARRVLEYGGYKVKQAMNITDVGHLTSDADEGEDKLQKSAREQKTTAWEISKKYTAQFLEDASKLNIQPVHILCKATDHISEQIELIKRLEDNEFTYITSDGVYYDTSKFPRYGDLARLDVEGLQAGARIEMGEKRNKTDFALWKFSKPGEKRDMEWDSPFGKGFPGWHIECSAMSMKYLGETFDIHTGGIDHIPLHHTNEIAQSEGATGKKFVNYWLHSDFLVMSDQEKMSKSLGNVINLGTLEERGIDPLAYRYLCLGAHYRKRLLFGEEILKNASNSFDRLKRKLLELKENVGNAQFREMESPIGRKYLAKFRSEVFNDLNTPQALATMQDMLGDNSLSDVDKYGLLMDFNKVFGLGLDKIQPEKLDMDKEIQTLLEKRENARKNRDWDGADEIRNEIYNSGFVIEDTPKGPRLKKR
ncbi:MAG: cysteine--tRNA ligase [Nanoarchaeota archaeon]|nr:cysteine--tRNA ligase [Nanoarchaeota archaeon]